MKRNTLSSQWTGHLMSLWSPKIFIAICECFVVKSFFPPCPSSFGLSRFFRPKCVRRGGLFSGTKDLESRKKRSRRHDHCDSQCVPFPKENAKHVKIKHKWTVTAGDRVLAADNSRPSSIKATRFCPPPGID